MIKNKIFRDRLGIILISEGRIWRRARLAGVAAVLREVFLEEGDLVGDVDHGRPPRRRELRAHEPELDELEHDVPRELLVAQRVGKGRRPPERRLRDDGLNVMWVVMLHPLMQREPLMEHYVCWSLPCDQLQYQNPKAVYITLY